MKAQDLRIGNYVINWHGKECKVTFDHYLFHYDREQGFKDEWSSYKPIGLTEEWLIKFGYKVKKGLLSSEFYDKHFSVTVDTKGKFDFWISECDDCAVIKEIKYVHQLQNLYYSLTGEELTINE